jgi:hypothetical protein
MAGLGLEQKKSFWGPMFGIYWERNNFSFSARGIYSASCAFHESYSQSEQNAYPDATFVYIKGFDPNSWYEATFLLKNVVNSWNLGLTSKRFYSTGILVEYDPYNLFEENRKDVDFLNQLKLWTIIGRDLEFGINSVRAGVTININ